MYKGEKIKNKSFLLYSILEQKCKTQEQKIKKMEKELFEKNLELNIAKKKILKLENKIFKK